MKINDITECSQCIRASGFLVTPSRDDVESRDRQIAVQEFNPEARYRDERTLL